MGKKDENLSKFEKYIGSRVPKFITLPIDIIKEHTFGYIVDLIKSEFMNKYGSEPISDSFVSVRSSGSISTPGRMDTVLNVNLDTLEQALNKVYDSSKSRKLEVYLELMEVKDFQANIIIQEMVYGNKTDKSCSGVLLTENPFTSDISESTKPYIEYVPHSTGDKLMSGIQTPKNDLHQFNIKGYVKLMGQINRICREFPYICEVEFVIEDEEAYILQIREYTNNSSIQCIPLSGLKTKHIGEGNTVIIHMAKGKVTFDKSKINKNSILITDETDWEDTKMLINCEGVITRRGGRLSHAALISKEFYIPCIVGAEFKEEPKEGEEILFIGNGTIYKILNDDMNFKIKR